MIYVGYGDSISQTNLTNWLHPVEMSLLNREYDAVGWYFLVAKATGNNLWGLMDAAWKAYVSGGNAGYIATLGGTSPAVAAAWGASLLNNPAWGAPWTTPGLNVPASAHADITAATFPKTGPISDWAATVDSFQSAPNGFVQVSDSAGDASVHDSLNHSWIGQPGELFCVGKTACTDTNLVCPDGELPSGTHPSDLPQLTPPFTVAAAAGANGATLSVTSAQAPPKDDQPVVLPVTDPECNPPLSLVTGYTWGDPHIGTLNGSTYDFQGAGEYTLVRSSTGDLDVQIRQQPTHLSAPSINNSIAFATAAAFLVGRTRVEVDADSSAVLINGRRTSLVDGGRPLTLPEGGQVALRGGKYSPEVEVTWPDGCSANTLVDAYGVSVIFSAPKRLLVDLTGLLTADVTTASTAPGNEVLLGGNGRRYVLNPLTMPGFATLYHSFAPTWLVHRGDSLFTYAKGKHTTSYLVPGFPRTIESDDTELADLPPAATTKLDDSCTPSNVNIPALQADCVFDGAELGQKFWADFGAVLEQAAWLVASGKLPPDSTDAGVQTTTTTTTSTPSSLNATELAGTGNVSVTEALNHPCDLLTLAQADAAADVHFSTTRTPAAGECQIGAGSSDFIQVSIQSGAWTNWITTTSQQTTSSLSSLGHDATWIATKGVPGGQLGLNVGGPNKVTYSIDIQTNEGGVGEATVLAQDALSNL
jgi:hypothetical protein